MRVVRELILHLLRSSPGEDIAKIQLIVLERTKWLSPNQKIRIMMMLKQALKVQGEES